MHVLRAVGAQDIIGDLKCELEVEGVSAGLRRVQHRNVVKARHICSMMEKINTKEWVNILKNTLKKF